MTDYAKLGQEIGELVQSKNKAYGSSFSKSGDILAILYPSGVRPGQYTDMLAIVRIVDKLFRIATDKDALGEDPWRDVAGYALLSAARRPVPDDVLVKLRDEPMCLECGINRIPIGNSYACHGCLPAYWNSESWCEKMQARWLAGEGRH